MTVVISWALGIIAFAAMALLLYIVFCQIFLGHDGHTEMFFGTTENREVREKLFPWLLPLAMGLSLFGLAFLLAHILRDDVAQTASTGLFSLLPAEMRFTEPRTITFCALSLCFYVAGSVLAWRLGGERWSLLFCLNPWAVLMILPGPYSLVAFLLVLGYWSVKGKMFWLTGFCAALFLALQFPFTDVDLRQLLVLACAALVPWIAKAKEKEFSLIVGALAVLCGAVSVVITGISSL